MKTFRFSQKAKIFLMEPTPYYEIKDKSKHAFDQVKALVSSERTFLRELTMFTDYFVTYIQNTEKPTIPESDLQKIVHHFVPFKILSDALLTNFQCRVTNWALFPKISDIIVKKGPYFKIFTIYSNELPKQYEFVDQCTARYENFARALQGHQCSRYEISSLKRFMLKPIDHLHQYGRLLEIYLNSQDRTSIDYDDTQEAIRIVHEVTKNNCRLTLFETVCSNLHPTIYSKLKSMPSYGSFRFTPSDMDPLRYKDENCGKTKKTEIQGSQLGKMKKRLQKLFSFNS